MVSPVSLSADAIATLAFQKFIESGSGKLAENFTETALAKMDDLRKSVSGKLRGNLKAEATLTAVEQGSKVDLTRLAAYLQVEMDNDVQFAQEAQRLAHEVIAGRLGINNSMAQTNRDNARGWQTKVEGGTAYIGEIHIQGNSSQPY